MKLPRLNLYGGCAPPERLAKFCLKSSFELFDIRHRSCPMLTLIESIGRSGLERQNAPGGPLSPYAASSVALTGGCLVT